MFCQKHTISLPHTIVRFVVTIKRIQNWAPLWTYIHNGPGQVRSGQVRSGQVTDLSTCVLFTNNTWSQFMLIFSTYIHSYQPNHANDSAMSCWSMLCLDFNKAWLVLHTHLPCRQHPTLQSSNLWYTTVLVAVWFIYDNVLKNSMCVCVCVCVCVCSHY